jgi:hypothetical protein
MYREFFRGPTENSENKGPATNCRQQYLDARAKGARWSWTPHRPPLRGRNPSVALRCSAEAEKAGLCRALSLAILPFFLLQVYAIGKTADERSKKVVPHVPTITCDQAVHMAEASPDTEVYPRP